ncbi:MAG: DNA mismatch repair endonuclease MutL [Verrucomicrobia bacterium]|nr:DNA mismatch repair endonuclease MutL [Verrucomicrobiota bacterium]
MPKIHVLSDILASQVAAGEVVERPASVVKELVENSIDAGAREIRVDVDQGGSALIRVSDDGCGMSREDALLSLERHATSKLRTAGDLATIRTLGFRGEAVPSIASVSRFRMVTRERDATAGTEILVDGGKLRDVREAGCAPGTTIEAKALFFNMPARRKFLRAESTESAHVEHQLRLHALAAPNIRFRLRRDDREVFDLPPVARAVDRVRQLLGNDLARELVTLPETRGNGIVVEGFVLPAAHARKGRRHQFVFLNGRPVEDAVISRGLADGFRGSLTDGLHPAAWLWLDLEPTLVDVNVHPAKREVRFHRPVDVREAITEAVLASLKPKTPALPPRAPVAPVFPPNRPADPPVWEKPGPPAAAAAVPSWLARVQQPLPLQPAASVRPEPETTSPTDSPGTSAEPAGQAPAFRIIDVLLRRWVLMESEEGLVLLDPRAATERILYETLVRQQGENLSVQRMLVPVLLETDPRDFDLVLRERPALAAAGIEVEPFGGNTLQIQSLPACLNLEDPRATLGSLLDELLHEHSPGPRFAFERVARALATRAAVGVRPKLAETQGLLDRLFACDLPYCAPDGRPTLTEIGVREIERRFGGK